MENSYKFFNNDACEYFPCHKVNVPDEFNCKYCYCPLYLLECDGNYQISNDVKDCSNCLIPHRPDADKHINGVLMKKVFNKAQKKQL